MLLTSIEPLEPPLIEFWEPFTFLTIVSTPLYYTYSPPSAQQLLFPQYYLLNAARSRESGHLTDFEKKITIKQ
jgi:hypothetical protein